jgi:hypothetical protein
MESRPPDLLALIAALDQPGLRWVLVGGLALASHGGNYPTLDADIAFSSDPENVDLLLEALGQVHPRPIRLRPDVPYLWDRIAINGPWVRLTTDVGEVDLIRRLPGVDSFEGLFERAVLMELGDIQFRVASLEDLIAMKSQSDRAKDKLHLLELEALKKLRDEGG